LRAQFFQEVVKFSAMVRLLIGLSAGSLAGIDWSFHPPLVALGKVNLGLCEVMLGDETRWRRKRQDVWIAYDANGEPWDPITKAPFEDLNG
jgi:hypothetical protein